MTSEIVTLSVDSGRARGMSESANVDVLAMLLADRRSPNTRRAYAYDVTRFFLSVYGEKPNPDSVARFLRLDTPAMTAQILTYKAEMIGEGATEATVNRRLCAIISLVRMARRVGATDANPDERIDREKATPYRDTRGLSQAQARMLLAQPDRRTLAGKRDYALLLLLLENALRRAEVVKASRADYRADERRLMIQGKGRGTQSEPVTLSAVTVSALNGYLAEWDATAKRSGEPEPAPLFVSVSPASFGRRLTADGVYKIVRRLAEQAGLEAVLSPHRLRHTAITMALDVSGGDVRRVQRLSRHARLETLQIYDDNRQDMQGEMTGLVSQRLHEPPL